MFLPDDFQHIEELKALLMTKDENSNDFKAGLRLQAIPGPELTTADLPTLESVFLNKTGKAPGSAKIGSFPTKATRAELPGMAQVEALMLRVEAGRQSRLSLNVARRSLALYNFAAEFLGTYRARKQARGFLDFNDLIMRTRHLLSDERVATWVLFRLDGGIDHILVDEAQDTSPAQWDVIRLLAQEFTSGEGARADVPRTIFVVGDKKQSIYSFQGADPDGFDRCVTNFPRNCTKSISLLNRPLWIIPFAHLQQSWVSWIRSLPIAADLALGPHIWHLKRIFQAALMFGLCFKPPTRQSRAIGRIPWMRFQQIIKTNNWPMLWPDISVI
jgi:ATP-dependent exoDNAse (exonuclease V) beta subunit